MSAQAPLALDPAVPYREMRDPPLPPELRARALACFAAQRAAVATGSRRAAGEPGATAATADPDAVSAAALERILAARREIGGIVAQRELATAIPFNARHTREVVWSREVAAERRRLDAALARWVRGLFAPGVRPVLSPAGQWWYPPGTWFGWHTNHAFPGWRLYLSHAAEPGRSYFRYRDPHTGAIVTSVDAGWHLRCFEIAAARPFWHAIHAEADRFSVGWVVRPWSPRAAFQSVTTRLAQRLAERAAAR